MKNLTKILIPSLLAAASFSVPAAGTTDLFENIVFIGDSITQAQGGTTAVSYRYQLWKCFVDNDIAYNPVGSMKHYLSGDATSDLSPSYFGLDFNNTHEGHFSWNSGWLTMPNNINSKYAGTNSYPDCKNTGTDKGLSDWMSNSTYYPEMPNTATILMGVNDLSRGVSIDQTIGTNLTKLVELLQSKNDSMTIHVYSLLPNLKTVDQWKANGYTESATPWETILKFNDALEAKVKSGDWNTGTSTVVYHNITSGFDPTAHTYDTLHPNAQGELIIAGNMARALGIGQRTVGLERKGGENLSGQVNFSGGNATVTLAGTTKSLSFSGNENFVSQDGGNVIFSSNLAGTSIFSLAIDDAAGTARDVTVSLTLQMSELAAGTHSADNIFGISVGNGADLAGTLYIGESGIYWGGTAATNLLYGCTVDAYKTKFMVKETQALRIVYLAATTERTNNGVSAGYYVWLGDQLIGEALTGTAADATAATELLLGDLSDGTQTSSVLSALSLDLAAFAPSAIPEPSLFGLLAGTLALALAGTRRKLRVKG